MAYGNALAALADPTRRRVFETLRAGPRSVSRIATKLPVSRPAVSQHLKILKEAGLVSDESSGTRRVYRIDPKGSVARVLNQPQVERPNGIAVTPDAKTLYVIDSHPRVGSDGFCSGAGPS